MSKQLLEAALFMADGPVSIKKLSSVTGLKSSKVKKLLKEIEKKYDQDFGMTLEKFPQGYKLSVRKEFLSQVAPLTPHSDLSRALLRTLAIVAYKQPVKQSDIVKVIGNRTYEYIKALEDKGLVSSQKFKRTKKLKTTKQFNDYFDVNLEEAKKKMEEAVEDVNIDEGAADITGTDADSQGTEEGDPGSQG